MRAEITCTHDDKQFVVTADVARSAVGFDVTNMRITSTEVPEETIELLQQYLQRHPTRREMLEADLVSKAIRQGL